VVCDSPEVIRAELGEEVIKIITKDWQKSRSILQSLPGVSEVQTYGEAIHVLVDSASKRTPNIKKALQKNHQEIIEIRPISPRMEEAFISLIRKKEQEK